MLASHRIRPVRQRLTSNDSIVTAPREQTRARSCHVQLGNYDRVLTFMRTNAAKLPKTRLERSRCGGGRMRVFAAPTFETAGVAWDAEKEDSL